MGDESYYLRSLLKDLKRYRKELTVLVEGIWENDEEANKFLTSKYGLTRNRRDLKATERDLEKSNQIDLDVFKHLYRSLATDLGVGKNIANFEDTMVKSEANEKDKVKLLDQGWREILEKLAESDEKKLDPHTLQKHLKIHFELGLFPNLFKPIPQPIIIQAPNYENESSDESRRKKHKKKSQKGEKTRKRSPA